MRLIGYACRHPDPPLRQAYLPLGALTVLLGRNDAGKSSLLRAVERDLGGGHYEAVDAETSRFIGGVFFAEVLDDELATLVKAGENTRRQLRDRRVGHLGRRRPWGLGMWEFRNSREERFDDGAPVDVWLQILREGSAAQEGFDAVLDALASSRLVALEPAGVDGGDRVWNVSWCLPPITGLSGPVETALAASDLRPFRDLRERREAEAEGKPYGWYSRGMYDPTHGRPAHMWVSGAPVVIAPIGQTTAAHLPRGLAVPATFTALRAEVAASTNDLVTAARYGPEDAQREGDPLSPDEEVSRRVPRNWLVQEGDGWRIHPDAAGAVAFVGAAANRLLPGFLQARYRLDVVLRPVQEWVGDEGQALDLRLRARRDDELVEDFPVEQVADGLQLWVQLALLEACEQAARVGSILNDVAGDWWSRAQHAANVQGSETEDAEEAEREADVYAQEFEMLLSELRELDPARRSWVTGRLADALAKPGPEDWTRRLARHRRFFVVDEPERHLHPNLQREAAAWLRDAARQRGAPCLVATHSTPFLGLPSDGADVLYVYVTRDDGGARCEPFDPGSLRTLDDMTASLGFDRGELLTTVSMFLVVEGIHDPFVLERVFGGELRAARIALLPMDGIANYQAVLEADALWRYTTAEVAITTDKFDRGWLEQVISDPEKAKELRKSDAQEETKLLGKLIGIAQRHGKTIHLLGHRGADLIDVLDEEVVVQVFPKYPGHEVAKQRWQAEVDSGVKSNQRKVFFEREFGIPATVDSYIRLADAHAAAEVKPAPLQAIVDQAMQIATRTGDPDSLSTS